MTQTILSVVIEVEPASAAVLHDRIQALENRYHGARPHFDSLKRAVPLLHFMSMTVAGDDQHDPVLVLEANFDGTPGPFWGQLEAAIGEDLREMLRCGKEPRDGDAALFRAVTAKGSVAPVAPYLEARTVWPAVRYQGNRGRDRARIEQEGALFGALRAAIGNGTQFRGADAVTVHQTLRQAMVPRFPWLAQPAAPLITPAENVADWVRVLGLGAVVLLALDVPGIVLSLVVAPSWALAVIVFAGALFGWQLREPRQPNRGGAGPSGKLKVLKVVAVVFAVNAVVCLLCAAVLWLLDRWISDHAATFACYAITFALGFAGMPASALAILVWLRWLERRDPPCDAPAPNEKAMQAMAAREDKIAQNHMISIVHVKPGALRAVLVRLGLRALGLALRVRARNGYLADMRTIHFAHWALISNGGRLMFHSNFDGSWESYLDDFVEKAHGGLTLAWGNGVGFPTTRFLVLDGATQGRKFKAWARHSMTGSLFWFSAYTSFTVNQIERHARIADGLRKPALSPKEAPQWAMDL
jgi:hypothetical protein